MNTNNVKRTTHLIAAGELHGFNPKGIDADLKQLRTNPRLRSPFRFGGGRPPLVNPPKP